MKFLSAGYALLLGAVLIHAQTFHWNRDPALTSAGGIGKSYNWSSSADGNGSRPLSVGDDSFTNPTLDPAWTFLDADGDTATGNYQLKDGKLLLSGRGKDFTQDWRFFTAVHRKDIKGVFDVTVRVDSEVAISDWTKAGIIMANSLDTLDKGGLALVSLTPKNGAIFEYSTTAIGEVTKTVYTGGVVLAKPVWLRLVRSSNALVSAYYRTDSTGAWIQIGDAVSTLGLSTNVDSDIGLFTTSVDSVGKTPQTTTAAFDDFRAGGDIVSPDLDLRFDGTGSGANVAVTMAANFSAGSIDFTGYSGSYSFGSSTLTVARNLRFNATMPIVAGTGNLILNGAVGPDSLWCRPNDTLPPIRKLGAGKRVLMGGTLTAVSFKMEAGLFDFNNNGANFSGLSSSGGGLLGLGADDSLIVTGDADFSGFTTFDAPVGNVVIKSMGNAFTSYFNPANRTFPKVTLWTWATGTSGATLVTGPGALNALGGLVFRNHGAASGFDGNLDFHTHNPAVTVTGDFLQVQDGASTNKQILRLGNGGWSVDGNTSISLAAGSADSAAFHFTRSSGTQNLTVAGGPLYSVEHAGTGTLRLGAVLAATQFKQSNGSFDFNGFDLTLAGDLKVENGAPTSLLNLQGRTLTVAGNASFAGKTSAALLGLNPATAWKLKVTGSLTADSADIANSDASGGSKGLAGKGCKDSQGNKNWDFWVAPLAPTITRQPVDAIAKPGWKVSFSLAATGSAPLSYAWKRSGDSVVLSTDTLLLLDSVKESQSGSSYFCVASNPLGVDTSVQVTLTVRACDSAFLPPPDLNAVEGGNVVLAGKTGCASEVVWIPVSGPIPKLLDPAVDTLRFTAPRVKGDSILVLQYTARFGSVWQSKNVTVKVKDTIPDPSVSLAALPSWSGDTPRVIRPKVANAADLAKFPTYPLRYLWAVNPLIADASPAGDSLVLQNPTEDGNIEVSVCADNGGSPSCAKVVMEIKRIALSLLYGRAHAGPIWLSGNRLTWNRAGLARIVDWRGRILWESWGEPGAAIQLPSGAERSLAMHAARMEFLIPRKTR